jgi:hypothetical protein
LGGDYALQGARGWQVNVGNPRLPLRKQCAHCGLSRRRRAGDWRGKDRAREDAAVAERVCGRRDRTKIAFGPAKDVDDDLF